MLSKIASVISLPLYANRFIVMSYPRLLIKIDVQKVLVKEGHVMCPIRGSQCMRCL